jgi:hypothetical protein
VRDRIPPTCILDSVKTTVDIPEKELREAMASLRARTKREAIVTALEEFNRRRRLARLASRLGTFDGFISARRLEALRREP